MDDDPLRVKVNQPVLFDFTSTSHGTVELFPAVWSAAEEMTSPDLETRGAALERLVEMNAIRLSPLIAYLTATRLLEPDLALRMRIIQLLGDVFLPDDTGRAAPESVTRHLSSYLTQMRTRQFTAILQVVSGDASLEGAASHLFNACPYGSNQLISILSDRKSPLTIRQAAARMIGLVGYLDALPELERQEMRLNTRIKGQQSMPFAQPGSPDESDLLKTVQKSIDDLRSH